MAKYLTQEDLYLPLQASAYRTCPLKIEVFDDQTNVQVGTIEGAVSGTMSISADSDVRRTANIVVQPTLVEHIKLEEDNLVWLDKYMKFYVGLWNFRTNSYKWYPLGAYVYTDVSNTYDATTNQLTINCADFVKKLDGSIMGNIGAETTKFAAYEEDEEGNPTYYNIIRDAVVWILSDFASITKVQIDDIGEYYGIEGHNDNYKEYRALWPNWNCIPYDLEFSTGTTIWAILSEFRDLFPSYEMFFDMEDNTFVTQLVPTMNKEGIFLDNDYIQRVLISENVTVDMTTVRNVVEVWGQTFDPDFYGTEVTYSNGVFTSTIEGYTKDDIAETETDESADNKYYNGDVIALLIPKYKGSYSDNYTFKVNINGLGAIDIYNEEDDEPMKYKDFKEAIDENQTYCFKVKRNRVDGEDIIRFYYLGQWKVHALCVLSDGTVGETMTSKDDSSVTFKKYSKEYFQTWYNVDSVEMMECPDSPFTVQKIGVRNEVKTGDEYDNITSDNLALQRAHWETWKAARLTDTISITTALLPWLDVNRKVSYRPQESNEVNKYIIQSVSHDFSGYTTTISMYRFFPLYEPKVGQWNTDIDE